jgi:hypothetical protein
VSSFAVNVDLPLAESIRVTLGCIEGNPDIKIGRHVFVGSKDSWEIIPKNVTQHEEWTPENV